MIQDIEPYKLDNAFTNAEAQKENIVFAFKEGKVLMCMDEAGNAVFPRLKQLPGAFQENRKKAIYVFSIDEELMFLMLDRDIEQPLSKNFHYGEIRGQYGAGPEWSALAAVTAHHLNHWYEEHVYCGCCGSVMGHGVRERAMVCTECGNIQYPRISPVIMAAVTDGDRILVTRYAGRPYKGLALIAGFVEIGESLEGALRREVMEEVGLEVKDLHYFGSQPWGFSDSVISGFFVKLSGSDKIRLDRDELSEAVWLSRDEIPEQKTGISITTEMIEAFRTKELNF